MKDTRNDLDYPMQPVGFDEVGVSRFKENKIVRWLANGRLNEIHTMDFSNEDHMQLAQLIGYSISGYADLSYVSDESYAAAARLEEALKPKEPTWQQRAMRRARALRRLHRRALWQARGVEFFEMHVKFLYQDAAERYWAAAEAIDDYVRREAKKFIGSNEL